MSGGFCFYYIYILLCALTDPESRRRSTSLARGRGRGRGVWACSPVHSCRQCQATGRTKAAPRLCTSHCHAHLAKAHGPPPLARTRTSPLISHCHCHCHLPVRACMHGHPLARHGLTGREQSTTPRHRPVRSRPSSGSGSGPPAHACVRACACLPAQLCAQLGSVVSDVRGRLNSRAVASCNRVAAPARCRLAACSSTLFLLFTRLSFYLNFAILKL